MYTILSCKGETAVYDSLQPCVTKPMLKVLPSIEDSY